jgi:hypothetical protein
MFYPLNTSSPNKKSFKGGFAHSDEQYRYLMSAKTSPSEIPDEPYDPEIEPDFPSEPIPDFIPQILPEPALRLLPQRQTTSIPRPSFGQMPCGGRRWS